MWGDARDLVRSEYNGWKFPNLGECRYILEMKEMGICDIFDSTYWTRIKGGGGDMIIFTPKNNNKPSIFSFSKAYQERMILLIKYNW